MKRRYLFAMFFVLIIFILGIFSLKDEIKREAEEFRETQNTLSDRLDEMNQSARLIPHVLSENVPESQNKPVGVFVKATWRYDVDEYIGYYDGYPVGTIITLCNTKACSDVEIVGERFYDGYIDLPAKVFETFAPLSDGIIELTLYENEEFYDE
jgi:hypothetical protein|tara:strand:+ start:7799 stop:8260 length:462 start_codon:yes stop_codon:yes gene_type:complete